MIIRQPVTIGKIQPGDIVIMGIPFDLHSSFCRGSAKAPFHIRKAFYSDASNLCAENGMDLGKSDKWQDIGDLFLDKSAAPFDDIEQRTRNILSRGAHVLSLGGDHSITYPLIRQHAKVYPDLTILQLDAHPDLYDDFQGNRHSHACPFTRIMEKGLAKRLIQIGIRTMTPNQRENANRYQVETYEMRNQNAWETVAVSGPVYLSVDMDCLDPACAPGVSHLEPGGLTTREVLSIIQGLGGKLVGADIVEVNPKRDWMGMTSVVGAKLLKEILAKMLTPLVAKPIEQSEP